MEYIKKDSNEKSASVHSAFPNRVTLTLMPCSLNMAGCLHSKSIFLTYFGKKKVSNIHRTHWRYIWIGFMIKNQLIMIQGRQEQKSSFTPIPKPIKRWIVSKNLCHSTPPTLIQLLAMPHGSTVNLHFRILTNSMQWFSVLSLKHLFNCFWNKKRHIATAFPVLL